MRSEEKLYKVMELAKRHKVMRLHPSETRSKVESFVKNCGQSPFGYLNSLGFLSNNVCYNSLYIALS